jgi:outer membrane protein W
MKILQKLIEVNRSILLFGIILFISQNSNGQNKYYDLLDNWSVGLKFGSNHFSGDLSSNYLFFPSVNIDCRNGNTIGGFISKRINSTFTAKLDGDFTKLYDFGSTYYKEYFNSNIFQANLTVDADLFYIFFDASSRIKILPYAGVGLTFYHTSVFNRASNQLMRDTSYDSVVGMSSLNSKKDFALNLPIGLKVTQRLGNVIEVGADFRINNTLTDKIDGTVGGDNSDIYKGGLSLNKIPQNSWYDAWGYLGLTLSYKIPPRNRNYIKSSRYL